jgi:ribosomal protein S18 acetylase RimI-like enzyme
VATALALRRHDAAETLRLKEEVLFVYRASHAGPIEQDPWLGPDRFWERLVDIYAPGRDFAMVSGWLNDQMIGYAFGSPRDNAASTWQAVRAVLADVPVFDENEPVYVFREFAVHPDHQGKGYGRQIHDELLRGRQERLARLAVRVDNVQAIGTYLSWSWRKIASERPFPDAPMMAIFVRTLPL